MPSRRRCPRCGSRRAASRYTLVSAKRNIIDYVNWCDICKRDYNRDANLKVRYGITLAEYEEMLVAQDGKCAACGAAKGNVSRSDHFVVDHDHDTDEIRGLLCHGCNIAIGHLGDDPERAWNLIRYLLSR